MVVLGIDPGIATTGYGVIRKDGQMITATDFGVIRTPPTLDPPARLQRIYQAVIELVDAHAPSALVTERLFFGRNETTAFGVGRTVGVVLLAAAERNMAWAEYPPMVVKQAVVGYGGADKRQVQFMVQRLLSLPAPPRPDDAADALAIAICHAHTVRPYDGSTLTGS